LIRWLPSIRPEQVNVVLTGKDEPSIGLVNVISYDLLTKKIKEIQKVGYKVIIAVSINFDDFDCAHTSPELVSSPL
jgi:SWI/SNF-related matrix-associated actin-dependent regulator 1 of chromatin subfamily A